MTRCRPAIAALLLAACTAPGRVPAGAPGPAPEVPVTAPPGTAPAIRDDLPPVPRVDGPLRISVVYPPEDAAVAVSDSTFVFGSVGTGNAALTINGAPVDVAANGAWLAFLPVPADGVYRLRATADGQAVEAERRVRVPAAGAGAAAPSILDASSVSPRGVMTVAEGEPVTVRFRGAPGGRARLVLPDGSSVPLQETRATERAEGFMQDRAVPPREFTEYAAVLPARLPLAARDPAVAAPRVSVVDRPPGTAFVELSAGTETIRAPVELSLGVLRPGETRVAVAAGDRPDGVVIGTAVPGSGTPYAWQFPNGTRFTVTGERDGQLRVRLTDGLSVWVDADAVRLLPPGAPPVAGWVGAVRVDPAPGWVDVRLSVSDALPFDVRADGDEVVIDVYGAESRTNWLYYGHEDPLVARAAWEQPRDDLYRVRVTLAEDVWGWQAFRDDAGALVVRVRRPPRIDPARPLAGLRIGVDAGHPPGGAVGPTGYTEAEANLGIAKALIPMLREAGAEVVELRPSTEAVDLGARPLRAAREDVHLLVSIHNNAFPDGVNPWENAGTSVFYNRPQSLPLARAMQRELLAEFGLRDVGIAWADLALVRPSWMPAVLTETMFLMIPRQEAALKDPEVQRRIAAAHLRAMEAFLRGRTGS